MVVLLFKAALATLDQVRTMPGVMFLRNSLAHPPNGVDGTLLLSVRADLLAQLATLGTVTTLTSEDDYLASLQPSTPSVATGPRDFSSIA